MLVTIAKGKTWFINIDPCKSCKCTPNSPCKIPLDASYNVTISFTISKYPLHLYWDISVMYFSILSLMISGQNNCRPDLFLRNDGATIYDQTVCSSLRCPLRARKRYTFSTIVNIPGYLPEETVTLRATLENLGSELVCDSLTVQLTESQSDTADNKIDQMVSQQPNSDTDNSLAMLIG